MKSLKQKIILLVLPIFIIIFSTAMTYTYINAKNIIVKQSYLELENLTVAEKNKMEGWVNNNLENLKIMKDSLELNLMNQKEEEKYLLKMTREYSNFINIYYGTTDGKMINGMGFDYPDSYDPRKRPWYSQGINAGDNITVSEPYIDAATKEYVISGIMQLKDKTNKIRAIFSGDITLTSLLEQIKDLDIGEKGQAYILDMNTGKIIAHSNNSDIIGKQLSISNPDLKSLEKELMQNKKGLSSYTVNDNKEYVAYNYIPNLNWNLVLTLSEKEVLSKIEKLKGIMLIIMSISLVLLIILLERVSASIIKPIKSLVDNIHSISQGELGTQIKIKGRDEISVLSRSLNEFISRLNASMRKMKDLVEHSKNSNLEIRMSIDNIIKGEISDHYHELDVKLDNGILELTDQTEVVLDNIRNQTASSQQSLAALEEISATNQNMHNNMLRTSEMFKESLKLSKKSQENIKDMTFSMNTITESVENTNKEIDVLNDISTSIEAILTSINGVSDQTNLLALNAAIEAARAGSAGKGFAVVAEEIRKLAEQTNSETKKIEELISLIQKSVGKVKTGGEDVRSKVLEGLNLSKISEMNISKVMEMTKENSRDIDTLFAYVSEQNTASNEITGAIGNITNNSAEIEGLSLETRRISSDIQEVLISKQELIKGLTSLIEELNHDLEFFKF